jgi:hypothetical protein
MYYRCGEYHHGDMVVRRIDRHNHWLVVKDPTGIGNLVAITERDYRLLLKVARAAEQMNKTYGHGLCERELVAALDKLNARKERKP